MAAVRLVVGLGNPGSRYEGTRHNVGRDYVGHVAEAAKASFRTIRQADYVRLPVFFGESVGEPILFAKLQTYMNSSGPAIRMLAEAEGIPPESILAVVDDFMIPFGTLRLRPSGSSGGHNGLKSMIEVFGTDAFPRLRVGVGPVPGGVDPADFVLESFTKAESEKTGAVYDAITTCLKALFSSGFDKAMSASNRAHF